MKGESEPQIVVLSAGSGDGSEGVLSYPTLKEREEKVDQSLRFYQD